MYSREHASIMFVYRDFIIVIALTELLTGVIAHVEIEAEDYFFPLEPVVNYCKMSDHCTHDFVMICGQDSLGITRLFIDVCDMYEYNCDEKRQFRHVKYTTCAYIPKSP